MENTEKSSSSKIISGLVTLVIVAVGVWSCGGGLEKTLAADEIKQYEMCMRNNDFVGASVQAGLISMLYQEAGDEEGYRKWKAIEDDLDKKEEDRSNKEFEKEMDKSNKEFEKEMDKSNKEFEKEMDKSNKEFEKEMDKIDDEGDVE